MSDRIEIHNLDTDPNAVKLRYKWGCAAMTQDTEGRYVYTGKGNSYMGTCSNPQAVQVGHVIVLIARTDNPNFANSNIWYANVLLNEQDGDTYIKASKVTETGRNHEITISTCTNGVTLLGSAIYSPEDWEQVLSLYQRGALEYQWFDGDSYLTGGGLPLSGLYPHVDRRIALVVVA
ncbi:hypothetical protein [Bifidobacterium criceti]|uniref:Uncharacterized protein n=1 Tax=Bifidobacterium criceti TaxID=1960969 RepID=A0A2A2EDD8_9BIFI|nr:hypothetical protein [Bifidobacterium criceti]PAU67229.1 hypothetical protein B1526_1313 [Bifidobacterium criceti]